MLLGPWVLKVLDVSGVMIIVLKKIELTSKAFCRCREGASQDCARLRRRPGSSSRIGRFCEVLLLWLRRRGGYPEAYRSGCILLERLSRGISDVMGLGGRPVC
jgi:hypothetical protein